MAQAQVLAAGARRRAVACGDQRNGDAVVFEQAQALTVVHMKGLGQFALGAEIQAAIGEGAVHVEAGQANARSALLQVGGG